jgi:hypothetical protein
MDYPLLLTFIQFIGLVAMAVGAISTLHLIALHYVMRDWDSMGRRSFSQAAGVEAIALLAFAFASGGLFALHFFQTSDLPPLMVLLFRLVVLCVLAGSIVFMIAVAKPWLLELRDAPLALSLTLNRQVALTLGFASFASALVVQVLTFFVTPENLHLGQLAFMTLVFWLALAIPSLAMHGFVSIVNRDEGPAVLEPQGDEGMVPLRQMPTLVALVQPEPLLLSAHIPARRAPRPALMRREDIGIDYAIA